MSRPLFIVDAFTDKPFAGNPAAVCLLDTPASEGWMQHVAGEMNLSETAFVSPREGGFDLRWFTPTVEVDLCGHATLASAHVLWETATLAGKQDAKFHTRSGWLSAKLVGNSIEMDFPATNASPSPPPAGLADALGSPLAYVARNRMDYLVEVASPNTLRKLRPDFVRLGSLDVRGVIVTAASDDPAYDFVSRFFAPAAGVPEDPVTGSAHCTLGPYWAGRLGKSEVRGYQASTRGGLVRVRVAGSRVHLGGHAVTVVRGTLEPPVR